MNAHEPWHETENLARLERRLQKLYERPTPDPRFLARLEQELQARGARRLPLPVFLRPRWAWAVVGVLLVFLTGVIWLGGPRDAWAQFLRLIGYAPHVGFVNVEEARVLPAPVVRRIENITLRVEQVVATPEETRVVITLKNLSEGTLLSSSFDRIFPRVTLRASNGMELHAHQGTLKVEDKAISLSLVFPALPDNVYQVDIDLKPLAQTLHLLPTDDWEIALFIYPANSDLVTHLFSQPYEPVDAVDTHHNITIRVTHVVHTGERTALQLKVTYPAHYQTLEVSSWPFPYLQDDVGHMYLRPTSSLPLRVYNYQEGLPPGFIPVATPSPVANQMTLWEEDFVPLSAFARRLRLVIPALQGTVVVNEVFALDFGEQVKPGSSWPLDVRFNVDGIPVHITRVTVIHRKKEKYTFLFTVDAPEIGGKSLNGLSLYTVGGGGTILVNGFMPLRQVAIDIPIAMLPRDHLHVRVVSAHITVKGPWRFEWEIPRPALPPSVKPVVLHPEARASDRGITLWVDTLTLTDRVTVFDLGATVPEGTTLDGISARLMDEATGQERKTLWHVQWCREGVQGPVVRPEAVWPPSACGRAFPGRVVFGPLSPATKAVTLKVDAVTLFRKEPITLTVSLPERLVFDTEVKGSAAMRLDVDARVQAGPFTIHFTQGWVREITPMEVWLLSEPISRHVGFLSLPLLEVRGDGRTLSSAWGGANTLVWEDENCAITPDACRDKPVRVLLRVPLVDVSPDALPSRLDITLAGVRWQVPGEWNLRVRPGRLFWETKGEGRND